MSRADGLDIAVILPCFNEAAAIADVVHKFREALPDATIYVYDNNSSDDTAAVAAGAGAVVRNESMQGKGHVVRRAFSDIEADVYVMADGDDTGSVVKTSFADIEFSTAPPHDASER